MEAATVFDVAVAVDTQFRTVAEADRIGRQVEGVRAGSADMHVQAFLRRSCIGKTAHHVGAVIVYQVV